MLLNIVNPSDDYTIECPDIEIAAVIAVLMDGKYPLGNVDGSECVPLLMFGVEKFKDEKLGGKEIADIFKTRRIEVANALDSIVIGTPAKRELYMSILSMLPDDKKESFKNQWHDPQTRSNVQLQ